MSAHWCILRTAGRDTLRLAKTLAEDGFEVWTPAETRTIKKSRSNSRVKATLPIMPSYVFARSSHLIDLIQMAAMPVKPRRAPRQVDEHGKKVSQPSHASFSVMHYHDCIPLIADVHLQGLRKIEAKRTPKKKSDLILPSGLRVRVKVEGGSFQGMIGVVRKSDRGHTLVCFDNRLEVKIDTSLLSEDELRNDNVAARLAA